VLYVLQGELAIRYDGDAFDAAAGSLSSSQRAHTGSWPWTGPRSR
jgi:hypothetical protein